MDILTLSAQYVPQFLFAIILFWLCQRNSDKTLAAYQDNTDKQRMAHESQLTTLYGMLEDMLKSVARSLDIAEEKSRQN